MPQPRAHAKDLHRLLGGSTRAHHARVSACLDWLALHGVPAVPIATTGIPVPGKRGGFELNSNPRQVGISDIMACVPIPICNPLGRDTGERLGRLVLIEVKTGNAVRTAAQRAQQARFAAAGALCLVIRDVSELQDALGPYLPRTRFCGVGFEP